MKKKLLYSLIVLMLFFCACAKQAVMEPITAVPKDSSRETDTKKDTGETIRAMLSEVNAWTDGTLYYSQYSLTIENTSASEAEGWSALISVPKGSTLQQVWNAEVLREKENWTFTPVSYNKTLSPGERTGDIGFIISAPQKEACTLLYPNPQSASPSSSVPSPSPSVSPLSPSKGISALHVSGTMLKDEKGNDVVIRGISTHGLSWFGEYVNPDAFRTLKETWNVNCVRLAMYTAESGGYCTDGNRAHLLSLIDDGVSFAEQLGMYVIIDWHILSDQSPMKYKDEALDFFDQMSKKYRDKKHVIFEICNEPQNSPFAEVIKPYAEEVIQIIRNNGSDALILVGTNQWSQKIKEVEGNLLSDPNVMYTVHFYAATHKESLRSAVESAVDHGIPVLVSECSICDASGNGGIDYDSAEAWKNLLESHKIGMVGWNLSNKNETSAMILPSCRKTGGWSDDELSQTGLWFKNCYRGSGT